MHENVNSNQWKILIKMFTFHMTFIESNFLLFHIWILFWKEEYSYIQIVIFNQFLKLFESTSKIDFIVKMCNIW